MSKTPQPRSKFYELLQQQVHNEFNASQQYVAIAVWYDGRDLPRLARFFYNQSAEERNHALALVQYMLDTDHQVDIPSSGEVRNEFAQISDPVQLALDQEKEVSADIQELVKAARAEDDYTGEQFMQWFLKEQVEEVSQMSTLRNVVDMAGDNVFEIENYLAREGLDTEGSADSNMPPVAGGAR